MNNLDNYNYVAKNCDYTNYTGIVTVSVYNNDRLIKTSTSHNKGMTTLFNFISSCLRGDFKSARESRPCKIVLLKEGANEVFSTSGANTDTSSPYSQTNAQFWTDDYSVSAPAVYDTAAIGTVSSSGCDVTYHFRIPSLNLQAGAEVKKLLLLPVKYTSLTEACAYYILDNKITLPEKSGNITIIIDWKLSFSNQTNEGDN